MAAPDLPDYCSPIYIAGVTIASIPIDIVAQTIGNIAIDIAAQSVGNLAIDIAAVSFGTLSVDIVAQTVGNIAIDISAVSFAGNFSVDIAAQTVGNIAIDIAAQTIGNINIDIAAQTVDLNIKTSGGVNIVIDVLTQAAYLERRSTLSNNGVTPAWFAPTGNTRYGKFFPRGARGFLDDIEVYCRDAAAAGGTITVYLTPYIGAGYLYSANVTVPAGGAAAWRAASFNIMWNYDSLFIFVVCSNVNTQIADDAETPYDFHQSVDAGATWTAGNARFWFRAIYQGETVGDVPVSGTINNIKIPNASTTHLYNTFDLNTDAETEIVNVIGMGHSEYIECRMTAVAASHQTTLRVYCDGNLAWVWTYLGLNGYGYVADTPKMSLLLYAVDGICCVHLTLKFEFHRQFRVTAQRLAAAAAQSGSIEGMLNLIR